MADLNFYWRMGDYALEACPARLVRFDKDEPNVTINFVKYYMYNGREARYSIGYFYYNEHEPCWELKFVGSRFKDILEGDVVAIFKMLAAARMTPWKSGAGGKPMELISKQAAIDTLMELVEARRTWTSNEDARKEISGIDASMCAIHDLPSVQPEYKMNEWCTDCKEYDNEKNSCPRFNRVIREALQDAQLSIYKERYDDLLNYFYGDESILKDKKEFKAWLERIKWHVLRCDELARKIKEQPEVTNNAVHLCDSCHHTYPDCGQNNVLFGDGIGHDNICCCGKYEAQPEQKKGKWIPVDSYTAFGGDKVTWMAHGNPIAIAFYYCSECGSHAYAGEDGEDLLTKYCPECGADMQGEQNET